METYDSNKPSQYDSLIQKAADEHGVSYGYMRKLLWNESRFKPDAKSPTGPVGIGQFTAATAKSMGLNVDPANGVDDRLDPAKAIPATAKLLGSLVQKYNGDELKAALAYNQGEGPAGAPQLQDYDKGDFSRIDAEGVKYMRNLLDVAKSDRKAGLENFGGISPKANGLSLDDITHGVGAEPKVKVGENLPEAASGLNINGKEVDAPATPFGKSYWQAHGETLDDAANKSTFFGLGDASKANIQNSTLGMAVRAARVDNSFDVFKDVLTPTKWNSHTWTPEELDRIRNEVKNPAYINVVTGGSPENLDELIKLANQNAEMDAKSAQAGVGAQIAGGVLGAAVDPLSYVPMAGTALKGAKVVNKAMSIGLQSAALNVASEGIRTSVAGGDAHFAEAAAAGMLFGSGMSLVADGIGKALGRDPFRATAVRLEARETARNTNGADLSRMPVADGTEMTHSVQGVPFAELASEPGAVRMADGSILSATNPANPRTLSEAAELDVFNDKAAYAVNLGGFSELSTKIMRSESPEVRGLGYDLVRPVTGMQDGSNGKFGTTASDIHERLKATDTRSYNQLFDAVKQAMKDPEFSTGATMSDAAARQVIYKRAALAIERPELQANLTKSERKVMDLMKQHFDAKREMMENPAMFGNENAVSIFPNSRHKGTYVPNVYSREAKQLYSEVLGGPEGLQEAIKKSWLTSYLSRPEVKARVDEALLEADPSLTDPVKLRAAVEKYASDKAYGISHTSDFHASSVLDDNVNLGEGLVGLENNKFLEARNLFDSDMPITMPDGNQFAVNDLRDFDMRTIMPAYDRRVNGDIAIMGGTGKTTAELKEQILAMKKKADTAGDGTIRSDVDALTDTVKILTGRSRREPDGNWGTVMRAMNDLSFFAKNAYMGAQNITEVAGLVANGNVRTMLKAIPGLNRLATKRTSLSPKELGELHTQMFGKEVDDIIRPTRQDLIQRLRENTDSPNAAGVVGTIKFGTQELAARSPWTKMLNGTTNYLLDAGRQGVLSDVLDATMKGKTSRFAKDNLLKASSISKEQWAGVKDLINQYVTRGEDGRLTIADKQAFSNDPRAMTLWRLADRVADETMLRPHKLSFQDAKAYGPFVRNLMQFKSFTIKSLNGRFLRSFYQATKNNRAIDQALTAMVSLGLAAGYYVGSAHLKASSLPKEQQKDYLDRSLDPSMIAYAAFSRSSHVGAPLGIANLFMAPLGFDQAKMVRSSILPQGEPNQKDPRGISYAATSNPVQNFTNGVLQQVPSFGFAANAFGTGYNAYHALTAPNKMTETDFMTGLYNTSRELVPNDPVTQQIMLHIANESGIHLDGK
ncbi:peptidoglycan transglycosylase [Dickeya phage W2B]|uniref:Peptidoglycan transglycosylase n=1 Tax=Dickeya phage W2B TaxID=3049138 RepID=A0AA47KX28_9CAUD|nr:peptidoglycan transglycosylase [Dickeya phage W2B]